VLIDGTVYVVFFLF